VGEEEEEVGVVTGKGEEEDDEPNKNKKEEPHEVQRKIVTPEKSLTRKTTHRPESVGFILMKFMKSI
jgi:hypothetical protein